MLYKILQTILSVLCLWKGYFWKLWFNFLKIIYLWKEKEKFKYIYISIKKPKYTQYLLVIFYNTKLIVPSFDTIWIRVQLSPL